MTGAARVPDSGAGAVANVLVSALSTANVTKLGGQWATLVPAGILVLSLFVAAGAWRSARAYSAQFELYAKYSNQSP